MLKASTEKIPSLISIVRTGVGEWIAFLPLVWATAPSCLNPIHCILPSFQMALSIPLPHWNPSLSSAAQVPICASLLDSRSRAVVVLIRAS